MLVLASGSPAYALSSDQVEPYKIAQLNVGFSAALGAVGLASQADGVVSIRLKILTIIGAVLRLLAVIAMAAMVYGGFTYVTALGNEDRARKGKMVVVYTVVGIIIIGISAVLVNALIVILTTT